MRRFFVRLLNQQVFAFLLLILIATGLVTYLHPASLKPSHQASIGDQFACDSKKASDRLKNIHLDQAGDLKLIVSFNSQPSTDQIQQFSSQGITLYPDTWIFDYLIGETSYDKVCQLLKNSAVTYVDTVTL